MKSTHDEIAAPRASTRQPGKPLVPIDSSLLGDVQVKITARLGSGSLLVKDLLELRSGASLPLDTPLNGEIDILLNDAVIARGEVVAVGDQYGVRITSIAPTGT